MHWFSSHPYAFSIAGACIALLLGVFIVSDRASVEPIPYQPATWGGTGAITANPSPGRVQLPSELPAQFNYTAPYQYVSPFATGNTPPPSTSIDSSFDFDAFASLLTKPHADSTSPNNANVQDAYAFIPTGLISDDVAKHRESKDQAILRSYGDDVGGVIVQFEKANPDQSSILKNFIEDRDNPSKIDAMKKLGRGLIGVGDNIDTIVPPEMMHESVVALIKSYREIGSLLAAIPDAKGDDALVQAIQTYDAAAERFITTFVSFAILFPAAGVTFSNYEDGNVFMFSQNPSL